MLTAVSQQSPLLQPRPPVGEEGRVEAVFQALEQQLGFVPDALRLYSFSPPLLESYVGNIVYLNSGERLSQTLMAMIRYLVSAEANCTFCIDMNLGLLSNMGVDLEGVRAARSNVNLAPLPDKEKHLLKLALQAVEDPESVNAQDIERVKAHGWNEREIFEAVVQAANMRSLNFILRTFKVDKQGSFNA